MRYELIQNDMMAHALVRGLATRSHSIEDFHLHKENDYFRLENLSVEGSDEYTRDDDRSSDAKIRRERRIKRRL